MKIDLTLPEWTFLDGMNHNGDTLKGRTLIYHVRSASIIEVLDDKFQLNEGVISYNYVGYLGEKLTLVLHYCATLHGKNNREYIIEKILKPCALWYDEYSKWEDGNIIGQEVSSMN